jgi:hypothetical protein
MQARVKATEEIIQQSFDQGIQQEIENFFWQKENTEGTAFFFNIHFSSENIRKDLYNDIFCHVNLPG